MYAKRKFSILIVILNIVFCLFRSRSPSPDPRSPKYSAPSGKQNTTPHKNKRLSLGTFQDTLGSIGALGSLGQDKKGISQVPILQLADMKPKLIGQKSIKHNNILKILF